MAREKGTALIPINLEVLKKAPLDAKQVAATYSDLINPATWTDIDGNIWLFNGAIVGVANDSSTTLNGIYILLDVDNYTNISSWSKSGTGGASATYGANIGSGDASIYAEKVGDYLRFREIKALSGITVDTSNNTVEIGIDASLAGAIYNSSLDPSLAMSSDVGGYPSGTTVYDLTGDTFTDFVDDLLFPTVNPEYVNPNNSFSEGANAYYEVDANPSITFTATFSRGTIKVGGDFQDYRSGLPNTYTYTGPGLTGSFPSTSLSNIQVIGHTVTVGTQTWTNTVSYDIGPQPEDNKGNPYGSPLPAGTTGSDAVSLEGVYPFFGTTSVISDPSTKQTLVSMLSGNNVTFSMVPESGGYKQSYDIPDPWTGSPTNRSLVGIETYNTVSGSWEYQGGSAGNSLTYWTTSVGLHTIQGNAIDYTRYTYNGANRSSIQIRLKF